MIYHGGFSVKIKDMKKIVNKHPLAIRWFHWLNFPLLSIMIWSGMLIYWANDVYRIGFGNFTLLKFFPTSFYEALNLQFRLGEGMAFHFVFMWAFSLNGFLYVLFTIFSGEWRLLLPNKYSIKEAWQVVKHDLRISKTLPPQQKYNGAQRIIYTMIVIMGVGSVLSGIAIYKPIQFPLLCNLFGGYEMARIIHFILTIGYCLFFLVHLLQVIKAGWNNFRAMITGFEILKNKKQDGV
jgi:thiosulfate reductase cytochrome b subunit